MKFANYINESSTVVNKVADALGKILPHVMIEKRPWRFGIGVLASNKISDGKNGNPLTCPGLPGVTGIAVYIDESEQDATVAEITSASPGQGTKMIETLLKSLPQNYKINIHHDWSGGFWDKIMKKYPEREWTVL